MAFLRLLLPALLMVMLSGLSIAGNCGGAVICKCGDTLISDYKMSADLGSCTGDGLALARNISLDCQNHRISGSGSSASIGILASSGNAIKNCAVDGFYHGIMLSSVSSGTFSGNDVYNNYYGFDIDQGSGNTLTGNKAHDNSIGFYIFTSDNNAFSGNKAYSNSISGFYIALSSGNVFSANDAKTNDGSGFYLYSSTGNTFSANTADTEAGKGYEFESSPNNAFSGNSGAVSNASTSEGSGQIKGPSIMGALSGRSCQEADTVLVDGSADLSKKLAGIHTVSITDGSGLVFVQFDWDFSKPLDLSKTGIVCEIQRKGQGYTEFDLEGAVSGTKKIYLYGSCSKKICAVDGAPSDAFKSNPLTCDAMLFSNCGSGGQTIGNYSCRQTGTSCSYMVSGMDHSAVKELSGVIHSVVTLNSDVQNASGQKPLSGAGVKAFNKADACVAGYVPDGASVLANCAPDNWCVTGMSGECDILLGDGDYFVLVESKDFKGAYPRLSVPEVKVGQTKLARFAFLNETGGSVFRPGKSVEGDLAMYALLAFVVVAGGLFLRSRK